PRCRERSSTGTCRGAAEPGAFRGTPHNGRGDAARRVPGLSARLCPPARSSALGPWGGPCFPPNDGLQQCSEHIYSLTNRKQGVGAPGSFLLSRAPHRRSSVLAERVDVRAGVVGGERLACVPGMAEPGQHPCDEPLPRAESSRCMLG